MQNLLKLYAGRKRECLSVERRMKWKLKEIKSVMRPRCTSLDFYKVYLFLLIIYPFFLSFFLVMIWIYFCNKWSLTKINFVIFKQLQFQTISKEIVKHLHNCMIWHWSIRMNPVEFIQATNPSWCQARVPSTIKSMEHIACILWATTSNCSW